MRRSAKTAYRILATLGALCLALVVAVLAWRRPLAAWVLRHALADAGATEVAATVTQLSPRHLEIQPLDFAVAGRPVKIARITVDRPRVFSASLGKIRAEGATATLEVEAPSPPKAPVRRVATPARAIAPLSAPEFEQVEVNGQLNLAFRDGSQALAIALEARPAGRSRVDLQAQVAGPGLAVEGRGTVDLSRRAGDFTVERFRLGVKALREALARVGVRAWPEWTVDGMVTGTARAEYQRGALIGDGTVRLRNGTVRLGADSDAVDGVTADATVTLRAPEGRTRVAVALEANGPGLTAKAAGEFDPATESGEFSAHDFALRLKPWSRLLTATAPAAAGCEVDGLVTGSLRGRIENGTVAGAATVHLREGALRNPAKQVSIEGITTDLSLNDLSALTSAPDQRLQVGAAQVGALTLRDGVMRFQMVARDRIAVSGASVQAFGGHLVAGPFSFDPSKEDYDLTLRAEEVRIEDVLTLFPDSPIKAEGRMEGVLPLTIDGAGIHFGQGWAGLKAGQTTLVLFNAAGLLTDRISPKSPAYATLQSIETGRTRLQLEEFRVDIHPADAPPGRSARLRIVGRPAEPGSALGTLTLDVNVNGPLEQLMNWGLQTDLSVSAGRR